VVVACVATVLLREEGTAVDRSTEGAAVPDCMLTLAVVA